MEPEAINTLPASGAQSRYGDSIWICFGRAESDFASTIGTTPLWCSASMASGFTGADSLMVLQEDPYLRSEYVRAPSCSPSGSFRQSRPSAHRTSTSLGMPTRFWPAGGETANPSPKHAEQQHGAFRGVSKTV